MLLIIAIFNPHNIKLFYKFRFLSVAVLKIVINSLTLLPLKWCLGLLHLNLIRLVTALALEYVGSDPMWLPKLGHERTCSFRVVGWNNSSSTV